MAQSRTETMTATFDISEITQELLEEIEHLFIDTVNDELERDNLSSYISKELRSNISKYKNDRRFSKTDEFDVHNLPKPSEKKEKLDNVLYTQDNIKIVFNRIFSELVEQTLDRVTVMGDRFLADIHQFPNYHRFQDFDEFNNKLISKEFSHISIKFATNLWAIIRVELALCRQKRAIDLIAKKILTEDTLVVEIDFLTDSPEKEVISLEEDFKDVRGF